MKKNLFTIIAIITLVLSGCANLASSDPTEDPVVTNPTDPTNPANPGNTTDPTNPGEVTAKNIVPIMKWTKVAATASRAALHTGTISADAFTLTNDPDLNHCVIVKFSEWKDMTARLSAPMFDGFETNVDIKNGDQYTSTSYSRTIITTVAINEVDGSITYNGQYQDGGGFYTLTIKADNSYTFRNRMIIDLCTIDDTVALQADGSYSIYEFRRYIIESRASGTISADENGDLESEGESETIFVELMPGTYGGWDATGYKDGDLRICIDDFWNQFSITAYVYKNLTKSSKNVYAIMNKVEGSNFDYYYDLYNEGFFDVNERKNVTYDNAEFDGDKLFSLTGVNSYKNSAVTGYDRLAKKVDGVWQPTEYTCDYSMGSPVLPAARDRSTLVAIWDQI